MSSSRWDPFEGCRACGAPVSLACRNPDQSPALRPCIGRRLRRTAAAEKRAARQRQRAEQSNNDTRALVALCVREMKALTAQHERVMALLVSIREKQLQPKEGQ